MPRALPSRVRLAKQIFQFGAHGRHGQLLQAVGVAKNFQPRARWTPDGLGGVGPQHQAGQSDRRREMRDAGVMSEKRAAGPQTQRKFGQRQVPGDGAARGRQGGRETFQPVAFRFATDEEKIQRRLGGELMQQFRPIFFGPVFAFAAAAGMEGVSSQSKRVLGRSADCIFAGSPMSTRSTCNPHGCITSRSRRATPWYRSSCASTWSPGRNA